MKKLISLILSTLIILNVFCALGISASAETTTEPPTTEKTISDDFKYTLYDDGTAMITKYTGESENVVIPDTIY